MIHASAGAVKRDRVVTRYEVQDRNEGFVLIDKSREYQREVASAWPEKGVWRWRLNYEKFAGEPYPTATNRDEVLDAMKNKLKTQAT